MIRSRTPGSRYASTPPRSSRGSPFRNVFQQRGHTSADSILQDMTISFDDKVLTIVRRRSEQIMSRYVRLNYLGREDCSVLEGCRSQCESFMNNVENCIRAAVNRDESMSQSIVRRAYEQWKVCNDLSSQISLVLEGKTKRKPQSPPRATTPHRSFADRSSNRQPELEELKALQRVRNIDRETATRIYDLCVSIYGRDKGHVEFVAWLSLVPPTTMQGLADLLL